MWEQYLDQVLPTEQISNLVIYTDMSRYWLMVGILDYAENHNWTSSLQIIEEITDEEAMEIRQSLAGLSEETLLLAFFSDKNPALAELQPIFPLLQLPTGYLGYSIIGHQYLPNQYFIHHLTTDYYYAEELIEIVKRDFQSKLQLDNDKIFLEADIASSAVFPFSSRVIQHRNLIFPATELVIDLVLRSLEGTVSQIDVIGTVLDQDELIDPFGIINDDLTLLIENGQIVDIQGESILVARLLKCIDLPTQFTQVQLSIGLGQKQSLSGFLEHDRLHQKHMTLSWYDDNRGLYLEMLIGQLEI